MKIFNPPCCTKLTLVVVVDRNNILRELDYVMPPHHYYQSIPSTRAMIDFYNPRTQLEIMALNPHFQFNELCLACLRKKKLKLLLIQYLNTLGTKSRRDISLKPPLI